jgi:hypothetical protein
MLWNASTIMPVWVAMAMTSRSFSVNIAIASLSPATMALQDGPDFHK